MDDMILLAPLSAAKNWYDGMMADAGMCSGRRIAEAEAQERGSAKEERGSRNTSSSFFSLLFSLSMAACENVDRACGLSDERFCVRARKEKGERMRKPPRDTNCRRERE